MTLQSIVRLRIASALTTKPPKLAYSNESLSYLSVALTQVLNLMSKAAMST
jgi:hypothetical protein